MEALPQYQIINFYEFKEMTTVGDLELIKLSLKELLSATGVRGTIILANEGFNASVCGTQEEIDSFLPLIEELLDTRLKPKVSFHDNRPLRKIDVKIKPEIVTLKQSVDISKGKGTHVVPSNWNAIINDPETVILDTRNDYEFKNGTFRGAINPGTEKFSDLPTFVRENLDPEKHKRIAMFCTGGIRCEKFAPYMKGLGFEEVYQLEGGILKYIEETPVDQTLWEGECFVFDERRTLTSDLKQGVGPDYSQRHKEKDLTS